MMNIRNQPAAHIVHEPPWPLHGHAYILNYWLSPALIKTAAEFRLAPSPIDRVIQVMLVRYHDSPVGPYDELLLLDHPLISKRMLSTIPKIYVSSQISVDHGQTLWGIPKELAAFSWQENELTLSCTVSIQNQNLSIHIKKPKRNRSFYINSNHLPASILKIRQSWQGQRYQFTPQFRGRFSKISSAEWQSNPLLFPDLNKARLLQSFSVPEFSMIFPKALICKK